MNKYDLPTLRHLRQTAMEARGLIGEVASTTAEAIEAVTPQARAVTLPAEGWSGTAAGAAADRPQGSGRAAQAAPYSQTVAVPGVLADEGAQLVQIVLPAASRAAWKQAGTECSGQGAGMLTFTAQAKPAESIKIFVVLQEVAG